MNLYHQFVAASEWATGISIDAHSDSEKSEYCNLKSCAFCFRSGNVIKLAGYNYQDYLAYVLKFYQRLVLNMYAYDRNI